MKTKDLLKTILANQELMMKAMNITTPKKGAEKKTAKKTAPKKVASRTSATKAKKAPVKK